MHLKKISYNSIIIVSQFAFDSYYESGVRKMGELFAALFLLVFVLLLVYVVKKLLDSGKTSDYKKFIIIPIKNSMPDIAKTVKAAYWDNKFCDGTDESEILIYPAEEPDENCLAELNGVYGELEGLKVIRQNELEDYINSKV